jgi:hypothetical protein
MLPSPWLCVSLAFGSRFHVDTIHEVFMKPHYAAIVATFVAFTAVISAHAQGTVLFETRVPGVVDAPVYLWTGELADGDFVAALYVGSDAASLTASGHALTVWDRFKCRLCNG